MMRAKLLTIGLLTVFGLGCKRENEPNKIIDTLPVNASITITPSFIGQQMFLLKRDAAIAIIPIINSIGLIGQTYPQLTGPDVSSQYTFQRTESHYGTAIFTIQFKDNMNAVIDPIQTQSSTTTLASVVITVSGSSPLFAYTENLVFTLDIAGDTASNKRLTGTSNFNGSSYSMTFTLPTPGVLCSFEGTVEGLITGSGSGGPNNDAATLNLATQISHEANGSISWEGNQGGIHFENDGTGYVVTPEYLVLIQ